MDLTDEQIADCLRGEALHMISRGVPVEQSFESSPKSAYGEICGSTPPAATTLLLMTDMVTRKWIRTTPKPIPKWDVHFGGLDDDRKDSTAPHITFRP